MSFPLDPKFSVASEVRRWVLGSCDAPDDAQIIEWLRKVILVIAHEHLASGPSFQALRHLDAEDLADEFLLDLRRKGKWMIHTKSGLAAEYRSWVTVFSSPAQHELWEILSAALHELAHKTTARRLDAPASDANSNDAVWTAAAGAASCDLLAFEKAAQHIRNYAPPAARKWHSDGGVLAKVIAPKDAQELTLALLHAADGALCFRDLFEVFKRHVFAFDISEQIDTNQDASTCLIHPAAMERFYDLAHERAALAWDAAAAAEGTDLLCEYFIPKHLEEQSVTLEGFGDPRRVHERLQRVVHVLRQHLALNLAEALDVDDDVVDAGFRGRFILEAMHILCEKCACRPGKTATSALLNKQTP